MITNALWSIVMRIYVKKSDYISLKLTDIDSEV